MTFTTPQLSSPTGTPVRITQWNFPGGLRAVMSPRPRNTTIPPYDLPGPPYYERYIYGSGDKGGKWSEVTNGKTHTPFTIDPLDSGVDKLLDTLYLGQGRVIARSLDTSGANNFLRWETTDGGRNWSMKNETTLDLTGNTNDFIDNNQNNMCYAGDGEVYTIRPDINDPDNSEKKYGNVWKSTDYGDETWEQVGTIQGWNCRGITYIGKDEIFDRKMFLCIAGRDGDGSMSHTGAVNSMAVMRSVDGKGEKWSVMQMLTTTDVAHHFFDGWLNSSYFAYLGGGVVLLQTDMEGTVQIGDSVIWKSTDYGKTWTETFRFPVTPVQPVTGGDNPAALDQYSRGIWYLGDTKQPYAKPDERYVYALVTTSNSLGDGFVDEYLSKDGGTTWELNNNLPRMLDTTTYTFDIQIWFPESMYYIGDNGAIPGLYD